MRPGEIFDAEERHIQRPDMGTNLVGGEKIPVDWSRAQRLRKAVYRARLGKSALQSTDRVASGTCGFNLSAIKCR